MSSFSALHIYILAIAPNSYISLSDKAPFWQNCLIEVPQDILLATCYTSRPGLQ